MKCAACKQKMVAKITELDLRIHDKLYLVNNVELEECQNCGERVIKPAVAEKILKMIKSHQYSVKSVDLPVVEFTSV